jgi:nucleoside-diphosphate-sugar epimerase
MSLTNIQVIILGGSGTISLGLRKRLSRLKINVLILSRKSIPISNNEELYIYNLGESLNFDFYNLSKSKITLFHLAHDFDCKHDDKDNINYRALIILKKTLSKNTNINMVFISTPIDDRCIKYTSIYQKQKYICEQLLSDLDVAILRPSLIVSDKSQNSILINKFKKFNIPIIIPKIKNEIAPIELDKFTEYLLSFLSVKNIRGNFIIKGQDLMTFKDYLIIYHNLNSVQMPVSIFKIVSYALRYSKINILWLYSEKILGLVNVPCLKKDLSLYENEWKYIIL